MKKTTLEQRARLASAGFVRVDGLLTLTGHGGMGRGHVITPEVRSLGRHDSNNGMIVIVTEGGEVWLSVGDSQFLPEWERAGSTPRAKLFQELCPHGRGAFVPCSNGEDLNWREIFYRLANPDWMPGC